MSLIKKNKGVLVFTISSLTYSAVQMLFGLIVLKWILPEEMGLWNGVTIASPFIGFLQLGLFIALNRELPFLIGKGDKERAIKQVRTAAFHASLVTGIVLFFMTIVLLYLYFVKDNVIYLWVLISFGIYTALTVKQNFLTVTFRSSNDFKKLGFIYLANIPVYLLSTLLIYFYGFKGFLGYQVIAPLFLVILLYYYRPYREKQKFYMESFKELLKTGIPFFALNYFHGIAPSFKKIILLKYLGLTALGLFSPAFAILLIGRLLPKILGSFIYPKMSKKFGETGRALDIWKINIKSSMFTTLLAIPLVGVLYLLLPLLFKFVFPEYIEGLKASSIILLAVIFIIPQMAYNGLNSVKAYKTMTIVVILKLAIYWFITVLMYKQIGGMVGIAWGIVASDFLFSVVVLVACYYELVIKDEKFNKNES